MDATKKDGVPKILPVLIVLILAVMYYFAAFGPALAPEKSVENFYASYLNSDYEGMAEYLSVFWSAQYLSQYGSDKPSQLLAARETIEKETAAFLAAGTAPAQTDLKIEVLPEYTEEWENTAMVVYAGFMGEEELGREVSVLLKENKQFYLYTWLPFENDTALESLKANFKTLDADYTKILLNDEWEENF